MIYLAKNCFSLHLKFFENVFF